MSDKILMSWDINKMTDKEIDTKRFELIGMIAFYKQELDRHQSNLDRIEDEVKYRFHVQHRGDKS